MSNEKNNNQQKPQLSQEQIKELITMMQNQKPMPKYKQYIQQAVVKATQLAQAATVNMDRFIKFIIKKEDIDRNDVVQTARGPILFGTYVIIIFMVIGGFWSAFAPLDSASVALGQVIPNTKRKSIQYPSLGTVKQIYVQVGDTVKAGDKIVELDEVRAKADYERILGAYRVALSMESRTLAERDNLPEIQFNEFLMKDKDDPVVQSIMKTDIDLFNSRRDAYNKHLEALEKRHTQLEKQLEGMKAKRVSAAKIDQVTKEKIKSSKELFDKGFLKRSEYLEMEARAAQAQSELLGTESEIARVQQAIAQDEAEVVSFKNTEVAKIVEQLLNAQKQINDFREQYNQAKDALDKIVLRSPVDGTVIEINVTTIGQVIGQGMPVAEILPTDDRLVIEVKIPSKDIDSVNVGLKAKIRFSAFKSRTSPVFTGVVTSLSPDVITERQQMQQQEPTYLARIELDMDEFNKIAKQGKLVLRPGMAAEVQIVRGTRSLLQYLLDPITDQMFKAFKEK